MREKTVTTKVYKFDELSEEAKETAREWWKRGGNDAELLRIATALYNLQRVNFYQLTARTAHRGHYSHSDCMVIDCDRRDDKAWTVGAEDDLAQLMRDFADWIYSQLKAEHDYRMSDETIDEAITCNEYEFTEDGRIY
jgi:hypothetical protein